MTGARFSRPCCCLRKAGLIAVKLAERQQQNQTMALHFSPAAIAEVNRIISKHPNPAALFRLGVQAGGCSELHYIMSLTEAVSSGDRLIDSNGMRVAIDSQSLPYLDGLMLDYTEDLMGGGFRFSNPNAVSSCGCGNSFSVGDR